MFPLINTYFLEDSRLRWPRNQETKTSPQHLHMKINKNFTNIVQQKSEKTTERRRQLYFQLHHPIFQNCSEPSGISPARKSYSSLKRRTSQVINQLPPVFQGRKVPLGYFLIQTSKSQDKQDSQRQGRKQRLPVKVTQQKSHTTIMTVNCLNG